ncbi:DUF2398 family protein [Arthrobacter sp. 35W]|uniref:DUF2398 family protein n=1 Tax=Arthrobacter sp. 35W TaxID=1132441 RepID=UPI0004059B29|nr:DUF2398 family protein [Arthrobacter sp. 35W]
MTTERLETHESESAAEAAAGSRRERRWRADAGDEASELMRYLNRHCWLVAGRDDDKIAAARRNEAELRRVYGRLGWSVHIDRDVVRLRKSPPARAKAYADTAPSAQTCSWFFLIVAAADSLEPDIAIGTLVNAARSAAADAGIEVSNDITERRAIIAALKLLDERGVIERVDGALDSYVTSGQENSVLLHVYHTRLLHVIANPGTVDAAADPEAWLAQVSREPDAARRMRRALVDDTCVHTSDLYEEEAAWLSQRVRGDDGQPLADAFGLKLERRLEGAAFVVPEYAFRHANELGPLAFPGTGTRGHAALLISEHAGTYGAQTDAPGPGWRGLTEADMIAALGVLASEHAAGRGGWSAEYSDDVTHLAQDVAELLVGINALRILGANVEADAGVAAGSPEPAHMWWFAPVTGRWAETRTGTVAVGAGRHRRPIPTDTPETPFLQELT